MLVLRQSWVKRQLALEQNSGEDSVLGQQTHEETQRGDPKEDNKKDENEERHLETSGRGKTFPHRRAKWETMSIPEKCRTFIVRRLGWPSQGHFFSNLAVVIGKWNSRVLASLASCPITCKLLNGIMHIRSLKKSKWGHSYCHIPRASNVHMSVFRINSLTHNILKWQINECLCLYKVIILDDNILTFHFL